MKKYQIPTIEVITPLPFLLQNNGTLNGLGQQTNPDPSNEEPGAAPWRF